MIDLDELKADLAKLRDVPNHIAGLKDTKRTGEIQGTLYQTRSSLTKTQSHNLGARPLVKQDFMRI